MVFWFLRTIFFFNHLSRNLLNLIDWNKNYANKLVNKKFSVFLTTILVPFVFSFTLINNPTNKELLKKKKRKLKDLQHIISTKILFKPIIICYQSKIYLKRKSEDHNIHRSSSFMLSISLLVQNYCQMHTCICTVYVNK